MPTPIVSACRRRMSATNASAHSQRTAHCRGCGANMNARDEASCEERSEEDLASAPANCAK
jgi:hypothetical protein